MSGLPDLDALRFCADDDLGHFAGSLWPDGAYDFADHWRERAAILEYDGSMTRSEAEAEAYRSCLLINGRHSEMEEK